MAKIVLDTNIIVRAVASPSGRSTGRAISELGPCQSDPILALLLTRRSSSLRSGSVGRKHTPL
jgi:hypothetical protein